MSIDIEQWLRTLGLEGYASVFAEQQIDSDVLDELTDVDLRELGIPLGPRKKLLKAIRALPPMASNAMDTDPTRLLQPVQSASGPAQAVWERTPGELKPVTMLFTDISGSTSLTEKLDSERTHELLYGVTQKMCEAIESHGGTVCRFMGDGVMAMFGAPVASELHAVNACTAALAMQQAMAHYSDEAVDAHAARLNIRVGLHSGEVVVLTVGEGDTREYDASGPTVPIAARMEQVARPGEIYITEATRLLAGGRIDVRTLKPVSVKGISEPVTAFVLQGMRSREDSERSTSQTPFVGRRAELGQFRGILEACVDDGQGETIYIRGEPGIGKTRLAGEFKRIATAKGMACHRGLVLDFGVGKGQDAIRVLVRSLLGIAPGGGEPLRQETAEATVARGELNIDQRVYLNDLLDLPQPTELRTLYDAMDNATRNRGKQAVVSSLVTAVSAKKPTLIIVEDIHWASPLTLAHIANLCRVVSGCEALLIITSRVEGDPLDRAWRSTTEGSPLITIDLSPLRKHESMALIGEHLGADDSVAEGCVKRAAGNPLFLEQLLHSATRGSMDTLPDSIQSMVLARIDRLSAGSKRAIQAASVIGQRFSIDCLRTLLADPVYECLHLITEGLIRRDGDDLFFTHNLIREGVYASLLKRQRCDFHARAAAFFADNDLVPHAEHLARAEDPGAAQAYLDAARLQSSLYRTEVALALIEQALLLDPTSAVRYELTCLKGELLQLQGQTNASMTVWRDAVSLAQDGQQRCVALMGVAGGLRISSDFRQALKVLDEAELAADGKMSTLISSRLHNLRGNLRFPIGEITPCLESHELAMKFAGESGSDEARANALSGLADVAYLQGRMVSAQHFFGECAALAREHGYGRIEVTNALMQGFAYAYMFDLSQVQSMITKSLEMARLVGNRRAEIMALRGQMMCIRLTGRWTEMGPAITQFHDLNKSLGMKVWNGSCENSDAIYKFSMGEYQAAREAAANAVALDKQNAVQFNLCRSLGYQALLLDDEVQTRTVLQEGERYLHEGVVGHNYLWFYRDAIWTCYRLGDWDLVERYADALEAYTSEEPLPWSNYYCAQARTMSALAKEPQNRTAYDHLKGLHDQAQESGFDMDARAMKTIMEELDRGNALRFPDLTSVVC